MTELKYAAAYIRVSDHRQEEYSPASQLKMIREYAKREGYIVPDEFVFQDDGISAKTVTKRPQFNNMIALAKDKEPPFSAILVWKFSRFARNQEESIVYKSLLKKNGVDVISISEPVMEGPFGGLIERIIEFFDEFYLIRLSGEVKRGMTEKVERGEPICAPAFGYRIEKKQYFPSEDAPIVRNVFEAYLSGEPIRHIAQRLASQGVRTRFGNAPDNRWIEYMLRNPVYIGKIRWCTEGRAASRRDYDNENIIIKDGKHEPIIPVELFNAVQEKIAETKLRYGKHQRKDAPADFMLKGLVRCSACGSTLVRTFNSNAYRLQCHSYSRGACKVSHSIALESLNASVISALKNCIKTNSFDLEIKSSYVSTGTDYEKLLTDADKKMQRIKEAYQNGVDTLEEYTAAKKLIAAETERIKKERLEELSKSNVSVKNFAQRVQDVYDFITNDTNSEQSKNEALRTIIERIVYNRSENSISLHFYA